MELVCRNGANAIFVLGCCFVCVYSLTFSHPFWLAGRKVLDKLSNGSNERLFICLWQTVRPLRDETNSGAVMGNTKLCFVQTLYKTFLCCWWCCMSYGSFSSFNRHWSWPSPSEAQHTEVSLRLKKKKNLDNWLFLALCITLNQSLKRLIYL